MQNCQHNIRPCIIMHHSELTGFFHVCVSQSEVLKIQTLYKSLKVVERETERNLESSCCCWVLNILCGQAHCPQHCVGLHFSDAIGARVLSNDPVNTNNLPRVAFNGVCPPDEGMSLVLCNCASWLEVRFLALALSWDGIISYGPATCTLYHGSWRPILWQLEVGTGRNYADLLQDNEYIWFWIPSRWSGVFQFLVCHSLKLHLGRLHYQDSNNTVRNKAELSSEKFFHIVLDNEADVHFFSSMTLDMVWTKALVAKYITTCRDVPFHGGPPSCKADCPTNSIAREHHDSIPLAPEQELETNKFEVDECIEGVAKTEVIEGEELVPEEGIQESSVGFGSTLADSELNNAIELCTKYTFKARQFCHIQPSEPMLVVQCPGCFAQFKGFSNRMLRLMKHIETHPLNARRRLVIQVKQRYKVLFELMLKRLS